jgi:hypothetical protein
VGAAVFLIVMPAQGRARDPDAHLTSRKYAPSAAAKHRINNACVNLRIRDFMLRCFSTPALGRSQRLFQTVVSSADVILPQGDNAKVRQDLCRA